MQAQPEWMLDGGLVAEECSLRGALAEYRQWHPERREDAGAKRDIG
jgi:hypothetical protein